MKKILPLLVLAIVALYPSAARAGIPILINTGDKIFDLDVPPGCDVLDNVCSMGFKYGYKCGRFGVFFCDLWTWGGEFVIYRGNEYEPIGKDAGEVAEKLGIEPSLVKKPLLYSFPLGWFILLGIIAVAVVYRVLNPSDESRAMKLLDDPRYQQALDIFARSEDRKEGRKQAVEYLTGQGIPKEEARTKFRLLARMYPAGEAAAK